MTILSIDEMKLTKDVVNNQLLASDIDQIIAIYKANYPTQSHMAISVPISPNADFLTHGNKPSPLPVEDYEKLWVSKIHAAGLNVIFRGTFCEAEGIYNFPILKADGPTYKAKSIAYVNRILPQLKKGDVIGILPESTGNAFNGNLFLTGTMPDDYNKFFTDLILSINALVNPLGVTTYITNNYTEINSGWAGALPAVMLGTIIDHYGEGSRTVADMQKDLEALRAKYKLPIGLQEWGDIDGQGPDYMKTMAVMFTQEIAKGTLFMVNFWCGWSATKEGILDNTNGTWSLNDKGKALIPFFTAAVSTLPVPVPPSTPTPIPPSGTNIPLFTLPVFTLPAFTLPGTIISDGKGNLSFTVTQ